MTQRLIPNGHLGFFIQDQISCIYVRGSIGNGDRRVLVNRGDRIRFKPKRLVKNDNGFLYIDTYIADTTKDDSRSIKSRGNKIYYKKYDASVFKVPNKGLSDDTGFVRIKGTVKSIGPSTDSSVIWNMDGGWSVHIPPLEEKGHPHVFGDGETVIVYGIVESSHTIRVYDIKNNIVRLYVKDITD